MGGDEKFIYTTSPCLEYWFERSRPVVNSAILRLLERALFVRLRWDTEEERRRCYPPPPATETRKKTEKYRSSWGNATL